MNGKNRFVLPLVLGLVAVLFFIAVVVTAVVLKTSDKIVGIDYECNYSHNSSLISSIAATLGNRAAEFNNGVCLLEKKEYGEAYGVFVAAAEKGLAEAQCALGQMYAEGLGVTQDPEKSEHWYRMAANQGERIALASLGSWYYDGIVVPKNRSEAAKLWRRALNISPVPRGWETWYANIEGRLGLMYLKGDGVRQNYDDALRYLTRAAGADDAGAQSALGDMYAKGLGVSKDLGKAEHWYSMAANQGDIDAMILLGNIYYNGDENYGISKDFDKAFHYYSNAANIGDARAQLYLAYMYSRGEGVVQDLEKAFEWTEKSAKQGFAEAQNELGRAYEHMKQDPDKAIEWYQKAAAQGFQIAQQNLARFYEAPSAGWEEIDETAENTSAEDPDPDRDGVCDPWVSLNGVMDEYGAVCTGVDECPAQAGSGNANGCP